MERKKNYEPPTASVQCVSYKNVLSLSGTGYSDGFDNTVDLSGGNGQ